MQCVCAMKLEASGLSSCVMERECGQPVCNPFRAGVGRAERQCLMESERDILKEI